MTHIAGHVINKRIKYNFFGNKKYFTTIKFDKTFNRQGDSTFEYIIPSDHYNNLIIGSFVKGEFDQSPDGLTPNYFY